MTATPEDNPQELRVLVVDDNAALRGLLRVSLQALGCTRVLEASTVERALDVARADTIDLVITDWKMKPLDGLHLVRALRNPSTSTNPYVPIIMLTAYSDDAHLKQARDCGANAFLVKPFTAESLARGLVEVLADSRPFIKTESFFGPDRRSRDRDTGNEEPVKLAVSS